MNIRQNHNQKKLYRKFDHDVFLSCGRRFLLLHMIAGGWHCYKLEQCYECTTIAEGTSSLWTMPQPCHKTMPQMWTMPQPAECPIIFHKNCLFLWKILWKNDNLHLQENLKKSWKQMHMIIQ